MPIGLRCNPSRFHEEPISTMQGLSGCEFYGLECRKGLRINCVLLYFWRVTECGFEAISDIEKQAWQGLIVALA